MTRSDGITAAELLKNHPQRALDWRTVAELTRQVVSGLESIHASGKVHGAIAPQNIWIRNDGNIELREAASPDLEFPAAFVLCSPQQAAGQPATVADDVYSVGSTLYELLTGEPPFSAKTKSVLREQIQNETPVSIPLMLEAMGRENAVPGIFKMVIDRCLQKDPAERPGLTEIKKLLPKEAAPPKKPAAELTGASPAVPSFAAVDSFNPETKSPRPRLNPLPILLAAIAVGWITFGTMWGPFPKVGAVVLIFTVAIGFTLAKRRNQR